MTEGELHRVAEGIATRQDKEGEIRTLLEYGRITRDEAVKIRGMV